MSDDNLDDRIEQAMYNWQSATQGSPGDCTWGFFSYGDAPPAIGGGFGMFIWFPSRTDMLDFVENTLPYSPPGRGDIDWGVVATSTSAVVAQMKSGLIDDAAGVKRLNEVLQTFSQIEWMGTPEDLFSGKHPYAIKVRSAFRSEDDDASAGGPIQQDEQESFCEFLETWGI